jgi:hypothetical protein
VGKPLKQIAIEGRVFPSYRNAGEHAFAMLVETRQRPRVLDQLK